MMSQLIGEMNAVLSQKVAIAEAVARYLSFGWPLRHTLQIRIRSTTAVAHNSAKSLLRRSRLVASGDQSRTNSCPVQLLNCAPRKARASAIGRNSKCHRELGLLEILTTPISAADKWVKQAARFLANHCCAFT